MTFNRKLFVFFIIILLLASVLLIYFPQNHSNLEKVTIMMPFIAQAQWIAYYTAQYNGYYEEEGLDVELQYSTKGSGGAIEQLVANNVEFALACTDGVIAAGPSSDIIAIYPIEPKNVFYIMSEKSMNISNPVDLTGKKIGIISTASGAYRNLLIMLYKSGLTVNDIELIQAGTAVVPSFFEKKFDAIIIHLDQKTLIEDQIPNVSIINAFDYSNISVGHILTTNQFAGNNPEVVKKFIRATKKGLKYATDNPEEAVDIFVKLFPDAEKELNAKKWNEFITVFDYKENFPNNESLEHWQDSQNMLYNTGIIENKVEDPSIFFTNEFNL